MASTVQIKRSTTPGAAPSTLADGELAINRADGKVFWKDSANAIQSFTFQAYASASTPTFTGAASFTVGTVTAPGIYFSTFTDTGLYRPATNSVAVTCAGTERMRWTGSGIWVTTPSIVVGTMTSRTAGPATHPVIQLEGTTAGAVCYQAICGSTTATVSPQILLARHRGAVGNSTLVASGDSLGIITWRGGDGTDCVSAAAQIEARVDGTPAANDMPGRLIFSTTAAGAETASERMRITSAGNVGIGTTGPTSPLHVVGTVDCDGLIVGTTTASATGIALLGAADASAGRTTLSAAAATHTHASTDISDSTTAGRALLTAADAAAQRTALSVQPTASPSFTGTLTSAGLLSLTSGQLRFPATANLSADANTIDDFEIGQWTPTFSASTTNPTVTYSANRYGTYIKIGHAVFFHGRIILTALTSAGSGNLRISGLPFTADGGSAGGYGNVGISYKASWTTAGPQAAIVEASNTIISLYTTTATAHTALTVSALTATAEVYFSGFYQTAS